MTDWVDTKPVLFRSGGRWWCGTKHWDEATREWVVGEMLFGETERAAYLNWVSWLASLNSPVRGKAPADDWIDDTGIYYDPEFGCLRGSHLRAVKAERERATAMKERA